MARGTCSVNGCDRPHLARGLCNRHYKRATYRAGANRKTKTCEACGREYETARAGGRVCSLECRRWIDPRIPKLSPVPWAECSVCRRWYVQHGQRSRCGRSECDAAARARELEAKRRWFRANSHRFRQRASAIVFPCQECGGTVDASGFGDKRRMFCGPRCGGRYGRRLRRARRRGGLVERFGLFEIAKRDGWRCHLCHRKVRPAYASIDHLVPLSRGGDHTKANVALAHWLCNVRRGADRVPAQLRLTG